MAIFEIKNICTMVIFQRPIIFTHFSHYGLVEEAQVNTALLGDVYSMVGWARESSNPKSSAYIGTNQNIKKGWPAYGKIKKFIPSDAI